MIEILSRLFLSGLVFLYGNRLLTTMLVGSDQSAPYYNIDRYILNCHKGFLITLRRERKAIICPARVLQTKILNELSKQILGGVMVNGKVKLDYDGNELVWS